MTIKNVWFDNENIYVVTDTGHIIGNPLKWFPRLHNGREHLNKYEISSSRESIRWPLLDEDLSLESFFDFKRELNYAHI